MLRLLGGTVRQHYVPRRYVLSNTDRISESKLHEFESASSSSDVCFVCRAPSRLIATVEHDTNPAKP